MKDTMQITTTQALETKVWRKTINDNENQRSVRIEGRTAWTPTDTDGVTRQISIVDTGTLQERTWDNTTDGSLDKREADNQLHLAWQEYEDYRQEQQSHIKVQEQDATKDTMLQDLINSTDYQYGDIPHITVGELRERMKAGEQYYDICPVDSAIREVHFSAISTAYNIDYEDVYQTRLHG